MIRPLAEKRDFLGPPGAAAGPRVTLATVLLAVLQRAEPGWEPLVGRAAAGDARARRELAARVIARVGRLALLMGARGRDLEEVVQAVIEEALTGLGVLRGDPLSESGLDRIAAAAVLARVDRWAPVPLLAAGEADPAHRASLDRVVAHLQSIEPRKRLALVLAATGSSVEDVAEVLDCTAPAASSRIEQARRAIVGPCAAYE